MKRSARLRRTMSAGAALMLMVTGMIPLSLVAASAAGGEPGQGGGAEGSSTVVTAPTSFGRNAEPI